MKISVITVTYNSAATLADTLDSVLAQDYPEVEHVLVDGASKDSTVEIIRRYPHVQNWISEPDKGLYDAINKGIRMATGDIIGILNSDDFFPRKDILSTIAQQFEQQAVDAVYGDIAFVHPGDLERVVRHYSAKRFHPGRFAYGFMPPHPSFYVRRERYQQLGVYQTDYKIAADYELLMRFLYRNKIPAAYIPEVLVYMRTGGVSNENLMSRVKLNQEIIRACKENGVDTNMVTLSFKYFTKIFEFIKPRIRAIGK